MLRKLLKYDLRATLNFFLWLFYGLAILFAILTRICFSRADILIVQILAQIFNGATISMIANILINNLMRIWVYFKQNLYGDEGYLMQTLPVSRRDLLKSKYLTGIFSMCVSVLVIIATLLIAYLTPESFEAIRGIFGDNATILTVVLLVVLILLELVAMLAAGLMGIILGHQKLNNRTAWSVLFGFVCYLGMQQVVGIGIAILALINPAIGEALLSNSLPEFEILEPMLVVAAIIYVVDIIGGYFLARKWFRKVDLD